MDFQHSRLHIERPSLEEGIIRKIKDLRHKNLWDAAKEVLMGRFLAVKTYIKKEEISRISNLNIHLKTLKKEEQGIPKTNRWKEIRIGMEISEIEKGHLSSHCLSVPMLSEGQSSQSYRELAVRTIITGILTSEFGRWDGKKDVSILCEE